MPDMHYTHLRLARVYDPLDPDRSDLDTYIELIEDMGAAAVLDVGCGTGSLACLLAERGVRVLGVDPAAASVEVARSKTRSDLVEWVVATVPEVVTDPAQQGRYDVATMTANVAQVFLEDDQWLATLKAIRRCLKPGGVLAFETRKPEVRAWEGWTKELTRQVVDIEGEGSVEEWKQLTGVDGEFVSFESPTIFHTDGERIVSLSTLRFRPEQVLRRNLAEAGFAQVEVLDLPYAPDRSWLFIAHA
ncbi:class I SAM-dependent methyltransferase [Nesterenkonia ebinurensis]|uniref:class I SAM-dependent methyltransferase n=1 Tax=Nesterenkonia ebinurensis TaxID=2608252 RepID=UPI00123C97D7|nr:class I SAM-dependent methyltransferase [Nesterenkonia ebinurensis]